MTKFREGPDYEMLTMKVSGYYTNYPAHAIECAACAAKLPIILRERSEPLFTRQGALRAVWLSALQ